MTWLLRTSPPLRANQQQKMMECLWRTPLNGERASSPACWRGRSRRRVSGTARIALLPRRASDFARAPHACFFSTGDTRRAASSELKGKEAKPTFCEHLIRVVAGGYALGTRLAAATYLKNFIKQRWCVDGSETTASTGGAASGGASSSGASAGTVASAATTLVPCATERVSVRDSLVKALLASSVSELRNMLAECFRIVASVDFPARWPSLVPTLSAEFDKAVAAAPLDDQENAPWALDNVLTAIHMLCKHYRFFLRPDMADETAPEELELIVAHLVNPLREKLFDVCVAKCHADASSISDTEVKLMRTTAKVFHSVTRSYMPASMRDGVGGWLSAMTGVLSQAVSAAEAMPTAAAGLEGDDDDDDDANDGALWRLQKRCLQALVGFHDRHHELFAAHAQKALVELALRAAKAAGSNPSALHDRVHALFLDVLARVCETPAGWRAMAPQARSLMQQGLMCTLSLSPKDEALWHEDEDEFTSRHLGGDGAVNGFRDDLVTARQSAMNLLGVMAAQEAAMKPSRATGGAGGPRHRSKRKRKAAIAKGSGVQVLLPLLEQSLAQLGAPGSEADSESSPSKRAKVEAKFDAAWQRKMYGLVMTHAAVLPSFYKKADRISQFLRSVVLPAVSADSMSTFSPPTRAPYLTVAALFALKQVAPVMPQSVVRAAFDSTLALVASKDKALAGTEDDEPVSWKPVRVAAAAALRDLIDEQFTREMLKPELPSLVSQLLAATKAASDSDDGEAAEEDDGDFEELPLSLLSLAVCKAEADVVPFASRLAAALNKRCEEEIEMGNDGTESEALEALATLVTTIAEVHAEETGDVSDGEDEDDDEEASDDEEEDEEDGDETSDAVETVEDSGSADAADSAEAEAEAEAEAGDADEAVDADEPTACQIAMSDMRDMIASLLCKYFHVSPEGVPDDDSASGASDEIVMVPQAPALLSFLVAASAAEESMPAAVIGVMRGFAARMASWWSDMAELEDSWEAILDIVKACVPDDDTARSAAPLTELRNEFFAAVARTAAHFIEFCTSSVARVGCKFLLSVVSCGVPVAQWMTEETAVAVASAVASKIDERFGGSASEEDEDDTGAAREGLTRSLTLVLAFVTSAYPTPVLRCVIEQHDALTAVLKTLGSSAAVVSGDEYDLHSGAWQQLVRSGMAIFDAYAAGGLSSLDTSSGRRLLSDVMAGVVKQVLATRAMAEAAEEGDDDEADDDEAGDDEAGEDDGEEAASDGDESGSEEEEEEEDSEEESDDDENDAPGDASDSDGEASESDEENDMVGLDGMTTEEFNAAHAEAARRLAVMAEEDDDPDIDAADGYEFVTPEHGKEEPFGVAAAFAAWVQERPSLGEVLKRSTAAVLAKNFGSA